MSAHQVHDKFKSFVGTDVETVSSEISAFVSSHKVKPVSIGVVHVAGTDEFIFSLGYQPNSEGHSASLVSVSLGHIDTLHKGGIQELDKALTSAAAKIDGIICHELVVTPDGRFHAVFLVG